MHPAPSPRRSRAFTLIELLTVIAIIGILASIIIPTVGKVRASANKAKCASNVRQLATACINYANDAKSQLPRRGFAGSPHAYYPGDLKNLLPYLSNANREDILFCPGPLKERINPSNTNYGGATPNFDTYTYYVWDSLSATIKTEWGITTTTMNKINQLPPRFPLWGCLTFTRGAENFGHSNPGNSQPIDGQNTARADGSVLWRKGDELVTYGIADGNTYLGPRP